ncbi:hypothetical protein [Vibrio atlanticus]|nr:hypothetical protein [Vibrio atlanticus]MCZ4309719.1 hypothetical protein [Vibrio atlanticus]
MKMSMFITLAVSIMFSAFTNAADYAVALGYAGVNVQHLGYKLSVTNN